jgi:hypothetical protein
VATEFTKLVFKEKNPLCSVTPQKAQNLNIYIFAARNPVSKLFYVSLIKNDKQTKKGKEINIFKSLARSNVFSTKSEEQEVKL